MANHKRSIKGATTASAAGGGLGAALAQLVIHIFPYMEGTEAALSVVMTVLVGLLGGYLVPPKDPADGVILDDLDLDHSEEHTSGIHAAEVD